MKEVKLEGRVIEYSGDSFDEIFSMFSSDLDLIGDEMNEFGFTESDVFAVRLCCEEVFTNAYRHGNKKDSRLVIRLEYKLLGRNLPLDLMVYGFFCSVMDRGKGFDPEKLRDPLNDENLERPNGRGVFLVKSYSDFVEFKNDNGGFTASFMRYKQKSL